MYLRTDYLTRTKRGPNWERDVTGHLLEAYCGGIYEVSGKVNMYRLNMKWLLIDQIYKTTYIKTMHPTLDPKRPQYVVVSGTLHTVLTLVNCNNWCIYICINVTLVTCSDIIRPIFTIFLWSFSTCFTKYGFFCTMYFINNFV